MSDSELLAIARMPEVGTVDDTSLDHERAVAERINGWIARANAEFKTDTVAQKLTWCWGEHNIVDREKDSTNIVGRDADYYFAARHEVAGAKSQFAKYAYQAIGFVAVRLYNAEKTVLMKVGMDRYIRTDKGNPNAPPGGVEWERRGAEDGFADRGDAVADVIPYMPRITID